MDIFSWSMPFVAEKVVEMLYNILKQGGEDGPASAAKAEEAQKILEDEAKSLDDRRKRQDMLRHKVLAMSRMMRIFKSLREDSEMVMQLKGLCPDNKVPPGLIMKGKLAMEAEITDKVGLFQDAKQLDQVNERMPTKH